MAESSSPTCEDVKAAVSTFLDHGVHSQVELGTLGPHAATCPDCYQLLTDFFRRVRLPESSYLRETLSGLAESLFNLGRALMREAERPQEDRQAAIRITQPGGGSSTDNLEAGADLLDDAEDFLEGDDVLGMPLSTLRRLLSDAQSGAQLREDLAEAIFESLTKLGGEKRGLAWNWIGVLRYQQGNVEGAVEAYRSAITHGQGARTPSRSSAEVGGTARRTQKPRSEATA